MEAVLAVDKRALLWINAHHHPALDALLVPISYAGELSALWIIVCVGLLVLGRPPDKKLAATVLITMLLADQLVGHPLAHLFRRERPYLALEGVRRLGVAWQGNSFPSGHAISVWIAALLFGARWPKLRAPLIAFALLTLYARPYLGMHYPLDVIGGSAIGLVAGWSARLVYPPVRRMSRKSGGQDTTNLHSKRTFAGNEPPTPTQRF